jgi:predicted aldo/keto reductase-like oxidoreductase
VWASRLARGDSLEFWRPLTQISSTGGSAAHESAMNRREFIRAATAAALVASLGQKITYAAPPGGMPYRRLGRTGEKVSILGIGGYHIGKPTVPESTAIEIVRTALDSGVNFLDNCWDYNRGQSEIRMGKALRDGYRDKAFLMTKLDGRTAQAASQQLDESLKRLQTDHIDLIQIHEVIRMNDPDRVFAAGGTIEALVKARDAGKVRYIGFTGHKSPDIHLHMLDLADQHGFAFDSVQMPLNVMDAHFDSFAQRVIPVALKKEIGVLGMKPMGDTVILKSRTVTAVECLQFTMSLPVSVCITGCDSMKILQQGLEVARNFKPLSQDEVAVILAKTEKAASTGEFELYKTTDHNDSTKRNAQNLG